MIPVLYEKDKRTFTNNGLGGLPHATSCLVTEERHGDYYLEMQYPTNGLHYDDLGIDRIIYAAPAPAKAPQAFRIERIQVSLDGIATIYAPHVSRQLQKDAVDDINASYSNSYYALAKILNESYYTSGFSVDSDYYVSGRNALALELPCTVYEAMLGKEGGVLDIWGGEYEWDNFVIRHSAARGKDTGLEIRYGSNMAKLDAETDAGNLYNCCLPYWKNEDKTVIGSATRNTDVSGLGYNRCVLLDVTEQLGTDSTPSQSAVTAAGRSYIYGTTITELTTSIEVTSPPVAMMQFSTNPPPERNVYLCDTVTVVHPGLNLKQKSKIVKCVFNVLTEKYESITIGTIKKNISDTIAELIKNGG